MPRIALVLLLTGIPTLGGCVAGMAVGAASMAASAAKGHPQSNEMLQPTARAQCSAEAEKYGAVHVIDVQQSSINKIIVWGTVDDGKEKQSFQCDYGTKVTGFRLRPIKPLQ